MPNDNEKAFNLKEYGKLFSKYDTKLLNQNMKKSNNIFKDLFDELESKDKENFALFSHLNNLQINVNNLKRSIETYEQALNKISIDQEKRTEKIRLNFYSIEVFISFFFLS